MERDFCVRNSLASLAKINAWAFAGRSSNFVMTEPLQTGGTTGEQMFNRSTAILPQLGLLSVNFAAATSSSDPNGYAWSLPQQPNDSLESRLVRRVLENIEDHSPSRTALRRA
jgi:hypothetical protein